MQVRVPSFFSIAMASSRDAFPIHNTHLPGARNLPGASLEPVYSLTRSLTFPSPSAPIRLPRSLRLPTATASSRWRRTSTPCVHRCASAHVQRGHRRTPWHPLSRLKEEEKEAGRERDHDAVAPTLAALKTDRSPFTTFQSSHVQPARRSEPVHAPGHVVRAPPAHPPLSKRRALRYLSTESQPPTFSAPSPPSPNPFFVYIRCARSRRGRRRKDATANGDAAYTNGAAAAWHEQAAAAKAAGWRRRRRRLPQQTQRRGLDGREGQRQREAVQQGERARGRLRKQAECESRRSGRRLSTENVTLAPSSATEGDVWRARTDNTVLTDKLKAERAGRGGGCQEGGGEEEGRGGGEG